MRISISNFIAQAPALAAPVSSASIFTKMIMCTGQRESRVYSNVTAAAAFTISVPPTNSHPLTIFRLPVDAEGNQRPALGQIEYHLFESDMKQRE